MAPGFGTFSFCARTVLSDSFCRLLKISFLDTSNLTIECDFSLAEQGEKWRVRESPIFPSPADLGFLPHCSGLLSQHVSFCRLVAAFALENSAKLPHGAWETTHWCYVCTVGSFHKCFSLKAASLGNPWEACKAQGLPAAARICWRFPGLNLLLAPRDWFNFCSVSQCNCRLQCVPRFHTQKGYGKNRRQDPRENVNQHNTMQMKHMAWSSVRALYTD